MVFVLTTLICPFIFSLFLFLTLIHLQCPDPPCKQDLLAYLEQIKFYSHQLKICSQVKAEIQNLGGELIVSAVSTACYFHCYTQNTLETEQPGCGSVLFSYEFNIGQTLSQYKVYVIKQEQLLGFF